MKQERLGLALAAAVVGAYGLSVLAPAWILWPSIIVFCDQWWEICWPF